MNENDADLYKYVYPTTLAKNTLAIIGCIQPLGAINPISEMQCRWAARVIKGTFLGRHLLQSKFVSVQVWLNLSQLWTGALKTSKLSLFWN